MSEVDWLKHAQKPGFTVTMRLAEEHEEATNYMDHDGHVFAGVGIRPGVRLVNISEPDHRYMPAPDGYREATSDDIGTVENVFRQFEDGAIRKYSGCCISQGWLDGWRISGLSCRPLIKLRTRADVLAELVKFSKTNVLDSNYRVMNAWIEKFKSLVAELKTYGE